MSMHIPLQTILPHLRKDISVQRPPQHPGSSVILRFRRNNRRSRASIHDHLTTAAALGEGNTKTKSSGKYGNKKKSRRCKL
ncbi:hypothetical protein TNCV_3819221 [Trichonephila clavipes]|nr:hypothetical protein TNCV_3819221 [Trichonephila clavipes]